MKIKNRNQKIKLRIYKRICRRCNLLFKTKCKDGKLCKNCHKHPKCFK